VVDDAVLSVHGRNGHVFPVHDNAFVIDGIDGNSITLSLTSAQTKRPFTIDTLRPANTDIVPQHPSR
jgi:hypothetical protein